MDIVYLQFNTCVQEVKPIQEGNRFRHWRITYRNLLDTSSPLYTEEFDSVMVCNGLVHIFAQYLLHYVRPFSLHVIKPS